ATNAAPVRGGVVCVFRGRGAPPGIRASSRRGWLRAGGNRVDWRRRLAEAGGGALAVHRRDHCGVSDWLGVHERGSRVDVLFDPDPAGAGLSLARTRRTAIEA